MLADFCICNDFNSFHVLVCVSFKKKIKIQLTSHFFKDQSSYVS